jgi:MFS family permease
VIGVGLGLVRPNLVVWLFEFVPPMMRGKAMGIMTTCYFSGQFISPLVFEPAILALGFEVFCLVLAALIALVICLAIIANFKLTKSLPSRLVDN